MTLLVAERRDIPFLLDYEPADHVEGRVYWDSTDHTLSAQTDVSGTTIQLGQENVVRVTNKSGAEIANGAVVYCSGAQGNRPMIELARADALATNDSVIGVATNVIADNANGYVTTFGLVRDVDTSMFTAGDVLYLSVTTAGAFTNVKPDSQYRLVRIGYVLNAHATQGLILANVYSDPVVDVWGDLRFPAQGINPIGSSAPPTIDTSTGCLLFSGVSDNVVAGVAQMPHAWNAGTAIRPHIHLRFPTANTNTSRWKYEYSIGNPNGNFSNAYGSWTTLGTVSVVNPNNALRHVALSLGEIDMSGYVKSAIVMWRLSRLASSDAADNDTSSIALLEFDIHYRANKHGSTDEF